MQLIFDVRDVKTSRSPADAARWTAIVPAAGRASRLNTSTPKILYPVLGKPILEWLIQLLQPLCRDMLFVLSPEGAPVVRPALENARPSNARIEIQSEPTGMADAIQLCEKDLKTPYTLVIWGDQITPRRESLAACMNLLESNPHLQATIPTIERDDPYIHFVREGERIVEVFQARESDKRLARGESDCGAFFFRTEALIRVLTATRGQAAHQGAKTKERNFLTLIPSFHDAYGALGTVRLHDPSESMGVNTAEDAARVAEILQNRDR